MNFSILALLSTLISACGLSSKVAVDGKTGADAKIDLVALNPELISGRYVFLPGDTIMFSGSQFSQGLKMTATISTATSESIELPLAVNDSRTLQAQIPDGLGVGKRTITFYKNQTVVMAALTIIVNRKTDSVPVITASQDLICSSLTYLNSDGNLVSGTKNCESGGVDTTNLLPGNIKSGVSIGSLTGTYGPSCSTEGETGCLVIGPVYRAASVATLADKVLSGESVAGVAGTATLPPANSVLTGVSYGKSSSLQSGSLTIPAPSDVLAGSGTYGVGGTGTTPSLSNRGVFDLAQAFPGAGYYSGISNQPAASTYTGTLIGLLGTATSESHSDCTSSGAVGCVTTATYQSADLTNLTAANVKNGVTIAGVAGQYPSATYPLTGSSGTADLTSATFDAQVKSSTSFEYWASDGSKQTGAGDADIVASNISSAVSIFGTSGSIVAPDPWDIRKGVTVSGVTGQLKVNCRSSAISTKFNYDGPAGSIGTVAVTTGTVVDAWDTLEDYSYDSSSPETVVGWDNNACYGVESANGDANVWKDVTTSDGVTPSTCAATSANCVMKDKITNLWWAKYQGSVAWDVAIANCDSLSLNGKTNWRLPTQKELLEVYNHGMWSAISPNWITRAILLGNFWSSSSSSTSPQNAWNIDLLYGTSAMTSKTTAKNYSCVAE